MATRVGQAYVAISADGSGIEKDIAKSFDDIDYAAVEKAGEKGGNEHAKAHTKALKRRLDKELPRDLRESLKKVAAAIENDKAVKSAIDKVFTNLDKQGRLNRVYREVAKKAGVEYSGEFVDVVKAATQKRLRSALEDAVKSGGDKVDLRSLIEQFSVSGNEKLFAFGPVFDDAAKKVRAVHKRVTDEQRRENEKTVALYERLFDQAELNLALARRKEQEDAKKRDRERVTLYERLFDQAELNLALARRKEQAEEKKADRKRVEDFNKAWAQAHAENHRFEQKRARDQARLDKKRIDDFNKAWAQAHAENHRFEQKRAREKTRLDAKAVKEYNRMWAQAHAMNIKFDKKRADEQAKLLAKQSKIVATMFGKGSRSDVLNLFGSTVGGVVKLLERMGIQGSTTFGRITSGVGASTLALSALVSVLGAALAGLTAMAATIASALAGAVLVLGGALTAVAASAGLLTAAFTSMNDAQKKTLKESFAPLKKEFKDLGQIMLADMVPAFSKWGANVRKGMALLVPVAERMGEAFAKAGNTLTGSLSGRGFQQLSSALSRDLAPITQNLAKALGNVMNGFAGMFAAVMPQVRRFSRYLADVTNRFSRWASSVKGQNAIVDFTDRAVESFKSLWNFTREFFGFFSDLFFSKQAQQAGNSIFDSLAESFAGFRENLDGDELERWFSSALKFGNNVKQVFIGLGDAIGALYNSGVLALVGEMFRSVGQAIQIAAPAIRLVVDLIGSLPGFAADLALAALIFPRVSAAITGITTALAGTRAGFTNFTSQIGTTTGRVTLLQGALTRLQGVAAGAAGVGGMVALQQGAEKSNTAMGALLNTAGMAAMGFSVGGPWGAAAGAVAGVATSLWQAKSATDEAKKAAEAAGRGMTAAMDAARIPVYNYKDTLDQATAALTKLTRTRVHDNLVESGAINTAKMYGISTRDVTLAALGREDAEKRVTEQINRKILRDGISAQALTSVAHAIGVHSDQLAKDREELKQSIADTKAWNSALKGLPKEAKVAWKNANYDKSLTQINKIARQYDLTPKEVKTMVEAVGVDAVVRKVKGVGKAFEDVGKTKVIDNFNPSLENLLGVADRKTKSGSKGLQKELAKSGEGKVNSKPWFASLGSMISTGRSDARSGAVAMGTDLKTGLPAGFAGADGLWSGAVRSAVRSAINAGRAEAAIKSPSRKTAEMGRMMADGLVVGMKSRAKAVADASRDLMRTALTGAGSVAQQTSWDSLGNMSSSGLYSAKSTAPKVSRNAGFFKDKKGKTQWDLPNKVANWAKGLIDNGPTMAQQIRQAMKALSESMATSLAELGTATDPEVVSSGIKSLRDTLKADTKSLTETAQQNVNSAMEALLGANKKNYNRLLKQAKQAEKDLKVARKVQKQAEKISRELDKQEKIRAGKVEALIAGERNLNFTLAEIAEARSQMALKIEEKNQLLEEAIQLRDSFIESATNSIKSYASLLSAQGQTVNGVTQALTANDITANLRDRLAKSQEFYENLRKLQAYGLNDEAYRQLVEAGVEQGGAYAEALLAGGSSAISETNSLLTAINKFAEDFGAETGNHLYQAGVDGAKALLDGLLSQEQSLIALGTQIGEGIAAAINAALGLGGATVSGNTGAGALTAAQIALMTSPLGGGVTIPAAPKARIAGGTSATSSGGATAAGKAVTINMTVVSNTADPRAVAVEMMNEMTGRL